MIEFTDEEIKLTPEDEQWFDSNTGQASLKVSVGVEYPIKTILQDPNDKYSGRTIEKIETKSAFGSFGLSVDTNPEMENGIDKAFKYLRNQVRFQLQNFVAALLKGKI